MRGAFFEHIFAAFFKLTGLVRANFLLIVVNIFIWNEWEILRVELSKLLINNDNLVITTNDVRLCRRLTLYWRDWVAWVTLKKETLLDSRCDELLTLLFVIYYVFFSQFFIDVQLWASQRLGQNAAETPNIQGWFIVFFRQNNLWWSVPSWNYSWWKASLLFIVFCLFMVLVKDCAHSGSVNLFISIIHIIKFPFCAIACFFAKFFSQIALDGENMRIILVFGWLATCKTEVTESNATVTIY